MIKREIDEAELQSERQAIESRSSVENSPSGSAILSTVFKRDLIPLHFLTLVPCVSTLKNSIPSWASFSTFTPAHLKHRSNATIPWDLLWSLISLNLQSDFFLNMQPEALLHKIHVRWYFWEVCLYRHILSNKRQKDDRIRIIILQLQMK